MDRSRRRGSPRYVLTKRKQARTRLRRARSLFRQPARGTLSELQARENLRAFSSHCVQSLRIQIERTQDRRRDLGRRYISIDEVGSPKMAASSAP